MTCKLCSPRTRRPGYLYVVRDERLGLTKIGCSVNVAARMADYRANGATYMVRAFHRIAGCEHTSRDREAKAIRLLAAEAERVRGDWFIAEIDTAIDCVERACDGYSGARWK